MPLHNWIVPTRRVVITYPTPYYNMLSSWGVNIEAHRAQLKNWYGLDDSQINEGYQALMRGYYYRDRALSDCRGRCPVYFRLRLWKGPLRVVWEELGGRRSPRPEHVYSRGMSYGQSAATGAMWDNNLWKMATYNWGAEDSSPQSVNYPHRNSESQRNGFPITPAWACVSANALLCYFMLDVRDSYSGEEYHRGYRTRGNINYALLRPSTARDGIYFLFGNKTRHTTRNNTDVDETSETPQRRINITDRDNPCIRFYSENQGTTADNCDFETSSDIVLVGWGPLRGGGHNTAFIKLYPANHRMSQEQTLDSRGFLSAYNPLTGEDFIRSDSGPHYAIYNAQGGIRRVGSRVENPSNFMDFGPEINRGGELFTQYSIFYAACIDVSAEGRSSDIVPRQGIVDRLSNLPLPRLIAVGNGRTSSSPNFFPERAVPFHTMREARNMRYGLFAPGSALSDGPQTREETIEINPDDGCVENTDAEFLPGDVVEFPLHQFLEACGLSAYSDISFNPQGSFLLGNSLTSADQNIQLHDNIAASRFQLLISLAIGAFYCELQVGQGGSCCSLSCPRRTEEAEVDSPERTSATPPENSESASNQVLSAGD